MSDQKIDKLLEKQLVTNNKVIIQIISGVAYLISKPKGIEVEIRDYDIEDIDAEGDGRCIKDEGGDWYQKMVWNDTEEILID